MASDPDYLQLDLAKLIYFEGILCMIFKLIFSAIIL
jgi:hypothetical protein